MRQVQVGVLVLFFVAGLLTRTGVAGEDNYYKQLMADREYGSLNRYVAKEVGTNLSPAELARKIGTMNELARKAGMKEDAVLDLFRKSVRDASLRGLSAVSALQATSDSIAFRIALEKEEKSRKPK